MSQTRPFPQARRTAASLCIRAGILGALASTSLLASCTCSSTNPTGGSMARDTLADAKQGYAAEGEPPLPGVTRPDAALAARLAERLAEKGLAYRPRTHHLVGTAPKFTNRLILETSPYLLQHAHNPVNWRPWGEAAFLRAEEEGKPVLMSVGYATCHWCHVMERESFEDLTIAEFINQHFIAIKVDREERPDIDDIYMRAVYLLTGHGGWPMTVVLTPAREPFFAGTYFPPFDGARGASQGFLTILRFLSRAYSESRDDLVAQAQALSQRIAMLSAPARPGALPGAGCIGDAADQYAAAFDVRFGGFGRAPKFPQPARLDLLLRHYRRTGDEQSRAMVVTSLDRMARGGMHDHVGGGFHRYSVDAEWLVPHFEKMLYDNAQLAVIYLEGYQVTGRADFRRVAARILDYVAREMTSPEGAFYSATDADSPTPAGHEEEGWFFTWTPSEIVEVLGEDRGRRLVALFGVTEGGNFEGRNILHLPRPFTDLAPAHGVSERALQEAVDQDLSALRAARQLRPPPLRDDKILTAWNGLMISAFSRGALILNEPRYQDMADRAARFLLTHLRSSDGAARGRLVRSYRNGQTRHRAVLEDYAFLIRGLLDLHEVAGERAFLEEALALQTIQDADHGDATEGGYFMTAHHAEPLIARDKPDSDGAVPSGNSVAAENLLRLAALTGQDAFRRRAELLMSAFAETLSRGGAPAMLCALERYFDVTREVVLLAGPGEEALNEVIRETYLPNRALLRLSEDSAHAQRALVPLLEGKVRLEGNATAYVCERGRCELPTRDPQTLRRQLRATRPLT